MHAFMHVCMHMQTILEKHLTVSYVNFMKHKLTMTDLLGCKIGGCKQRGKC